MGGRRESCVRGGESVGGPEIRPRTNVEPFPSRTAMPYRRFAFRLLLSLALGGCGLGKGSDRVDPTLVSVSAAAPFAPQHPPARNGHLLRQLLHPEPWLLPDGSVNP